MGILKSYETKQKGALSIVHGPDCILFNSGADPDFNKGGCLNEKGCTVAKPLSQWLCSCGGWVWEGVAPSCAKRGSWSNYDIL